MIHWPWLLSAFVVGFAWGLIIMRCWVGAKAADDRVDRAEQDQVILELSLALDAKQAKVRQLNADVETLYNFISWDMVGPDDARPIYNFISRDMDVAFAAKRPVESDWPDYDELEHPQCRCAWPDHDELEMLPGIGPMRRSEIVKALKEEDTSPSPAAMQSQRRQTDQVRGRMRR